MKQISFATLAESVKKRKTKRERFLEEMETVVPWAALVALIEPHYPKAGKGRRPWGLETLLRIYFMLTTLLILAALAFTFIFHPSRLLGFASTENFDVAFAVMTCGVLLGLPSFLTYSPSSLRDVSAAARMALANATRTPASSSAATP